MCYREMGRDGAGIMERLQQDACNRPERRDRRDLKLIDTMSIAAERDHRASALVKCSGSVCLKIFQLFKS